jgi:hypothetical protein
MSGAEFAAMMRNAGDAKLQDLKSAAAPPGEGEGEGEGGKKGGKKAGKGGAVQGDELKGEMDRLFGPEE